MKDLGDERGETFGPDDAELLRQFGPFDPSATEENDDD